MPLATFSPPIGPSPGTKRRREIKIKEAEFGDGYSQPTPNGLNHMRKIFTLNWDGLTEAQMLVIDAFFEGKGGTIPFYYQPAGEAATRKWTCKEWDCQLTDGVWKISAVLKQDFTTEV